MKEVVWISLISSTHNKGFPAECCHLLAKEQINILFLTCVNQGQVWNLNIVVDSGNAPKASNLIENNFGKIKYLSAKSAILSLFPHKSNPEVTGVLFDEFGKAGIEPEALANSNSAISIVLREDIIGKATSTLFGPFSFSTYRTPADWRLSQKGKEGLYKEVVASYQEKKPKVYGLEWQEGLEFVQVTLNSRDLSPMGTAFKDFAHLGLVITFLISTPSEKKKAANVFFCLPGSHQSRYTDLLKELLPEALTAKISPVAAFSMNGPHFGDRYGIASEILLALNRAPVDLLALSCSIATITGVLPARQVKMATRAIEECLEVPSVIKNRAVLS